MNKEKSKNLHFTNRKPFFIRNIPKDYDYETLHLFFSKFGLFKTFTPVFCSDMSSIRFIFIFYKEERSIFYLHEYFKTKNFIIDLHFREECESTDNKLGNGPVKCMDLRNQIVKHLNMKYSDDKSPSLYFTNKEEWIEKVKDIQKIIRRF